MYYTLMQITLPKGAKDITVTISDGTNPVQGATVTVSGQEQTTDSNGKANFEDILEGTQTVTATKTGFADYTGTISVGSTTKFTVTMTPVGTLTVTVTDSEDEPSAISGATVVIGETSKTTGDDGKAEFPNLTYEDKSATISADGYTSKTETLAFRSNHKSFTVQLVATDEQGDT